MAAANARGDAACIYSDESDSDGEFEGFSASDIERASSTAIHRNSDDEVDIDDLELDSDSDTDSDATPLSLLTTSVGVTTKNQGLRVRSLRVHPGVGLLSPDDRPSHRGVVTWLLGEPSWSTVPTSSPNRSHGP